MQRAVHSKRVARKKPIPKNREVKSRDHVGVHAGRTKTCQNTCGSIGHTALCNERSRRRTVVRITPKKNKDGREKDKNTVHPRRSKGRRRKYYDGRSTGPPAGNAKIRGGAAERKAQCSGTLGLLRLGKDVSGGGGLKSRRCREKIGRPSNFAQRCT